MYLFARSSILVPLTLLVVGAIGCKARQTSSTASTDSVSTKSELTYALRFSANNVQVCSGQVRVNLLPDLSLALTDSQKVVCAGNAVDLERLVKDLTMSPAPSETIRGWARGVHTFTTPSGVKLAFFAMENGKKQPATIPTGLTLLQDPSSLKGGDGVRLPEVFLDSGVKNWKGSAKFEILNSKYPFKLPDGGSVDQAFLWRRTISGFANLPVQLQGVSPFLNFTDVKMVVSQRPYAYLTIDTSGDFTRYVKQKNATNVTTIDRVEMKLISAP